MNMEYVANPLFLGDLISYCSRPRQKIFLPGMDISTAPVLSKILSFLALTSVDQSAAENFKTICTTAPPA